jgi:hypothetical protein
VTSDVIKRTSASSDMSLVYSLNRPIADSTLSASEKDGVSESLPPSIAFRSGRENGYGEIEGKGNCQN